MDQQKLVVIGGDAVGMSAASRTKRRRPDMEIEVFEMGEYVSYGACGMPYYISGQVRELEDLVVLTPRDFEEKRGIRVQMGHRVEEIRPEQRKVLVKEIATGRVREADYDKLLIATGAEPVVPPGLDVSLPGVFTLRGLPDAGRIKDYIGRRKIDAGVIVGAGYIGLEMAEGLSRAGLKLTLLVRSKVMSSLEEEVAQIVVKELEREGVKLEVGASVAETAAGEGGRIEIRLTGGRVLHAPLVLVGTGVRPRSELAGRAGLTLGVKGAIKVDRRQRTSRPEIFAAGDCAEAYHRLLGRNAYLPLALTANRQGRVVGDNIAGIEREFPGILGTAVFKVFDLTVARTGLGLAEAREAGLDVVKVVVDSASRAGYYPGGEPIKTVVVAERGTKKAWGVQMAGRDGVAHRINTWAAAISAGLSLEEIKDLDLAYTPPYSPVWDPVLQAADVASKHSAQG